MAVKEKTKAIESVQSVQLAFNKGQLLKSSRYQGRKDILNVILSNEECYELETVDDMIDEFMKGKVN